jgi:hypothetical protein
MIHDQQLLSILLSYLSRAFPGLHDLSAHSSLPNQWLRLIPAFRSSGVSALNSLFLLSSYLLKWNICWHMSLHMCGYDFLCESGLWEFQRSTSHFFSRYFSEMVDRLPRILLNRWLCSCFGTLVSSTRPMVLHLPPRSTIEIFFETLEFSPSSFLRSSRYGAVCPPSHRHLSFALELRGSKVSILN